MRQRKRATVPMRAAYNRLHQKNRRTAEVLKVTQQSLSTLVHTNTRLRRELEKAHSVELPEAVLTKIMDRFVDSIARDIANIALLSGAEIPPGVVLKAARHLIEGAMEGHTVYSTDVTMKLMVEDLVDSGGLRFTFTTGGPPIQSLWAEQVPARGHRSGAEIFQTSCG